MSRVIGTDRKVRWTVLEQGIGKPAPYAEGQDRERLSSRSHLKHVQEKLLRVEASVTVLKLTEVGEASSLRRSGERWLRNSANIIIAALLHRPKVLVVDEPVVGLDPRGVQLVKSLLRDLVKDGMTVFLSTHILGTAEELCPRIGFIHEGHLVALGSMSELREQAQSRDERLESLFLKLTQEEDPGMQSFRAS